MVRSNYLGKFFDLILPLRSISQHNEAFYELLKFLQRAVCDWDKAGVISSIGELLLAKETIICRQMIGRMYGCMWTWTNGAIVNLGRHLEQLASEIIVNFSVRLDQLSRVLQESRGSFVSSEITQKKSSTDEQKRAIIGKKPPKEQFFIDREHTSQPVIELLNALNHMNTVFESIIRSSPIKREKSIGPKYLIALENTTVQQRVTEAVRRMLSVVNNCYEIKIIRLKVDGSSPSTSPSHLSKLFDETVSAQLKRGKQVRNNRPESECDSEEDEDYDTMTVTTYLYFADNSIVSESPYTGKQQLRKSLKNRPIPASRVQFDYFDWYLVDEKSTHVQISLHGSLSIISSADESDSGISIPKKHKQNISDRRLFYEVKRLQRLSSTESEEDLDPLP